MTSLWHWHLNVPSETQLLPLEVTHTFSHLAEGCLAMPPVLPLVLDRDRNIQKSLQTFAFINISRDSEMSKFGLISMKFVMEIT